MCVQVTHNTARFAYDRPMSMARVDKYSVNTFLTLLTALGEDINEQVVAFKTKQVMLEIIYYLNWLQWKGQRKNTGVGK